MNETKNKGRGRPKGSKNKKGTVSTHYFTADTEAAIAQYNATDDIAERNRIYEQHIHYPFSKIAENIYNTFNFPYCDYTPLDIQEQCVSHLVANIDKFDGTKGKAFSYFSIAAKNWYIYDNNTGYKRFKTNAEVPDDSTPSTPFIVDPEQDTRPADLIREIVAFWEANLNKFFRRSKERRIAYAVIEVFRNAEMIDALNRKAAMAYISHIANCSPQAVAIVTRRMQETQQIITNEFNACGSIAT